MWGQDVRKEWIDDLPLGTGGCMQMIRTILLKCELIKEVAP